MHALRDCFGGILRADSAVPRISAGIFDVALHALEVVVVAVNAQGRGELAFLEVLRRVALAVARCSLLVTLIAWE